MGIPLWLPTRRTSTLSASVMWPSLLPSSPSNVSAHVHTQRNWVAVPQSERREGGRQGGKRGRTLRWVKHYLKSHYPSPNPWLPLPQQPSYVGPFPITIQENGGEGEWGGRTGLLCQKAVSTFQKKSRDNHGYITIAWQTQWQRLNGEEVLSPPFVLLLREHVKFSYPQDTWPNSRVHGNNCLFVQG